MNIIYVIDFNCPYSYIGMNRLKKALENENVNAEWEMKPFELETEAGKRPSISTAERYAEKNEVSIKEAEIKIAEIEKIANEEGLKINYKDMLLTSSKDALRLAKYTQNIHPEKTLKLVEEIFFSNLIKNENIANVNVLTEIAVSCGIAEDDAKKILENNYYNIECFLDMEEAISYGITATPCFILNHKGHRLIIPGAFSTEEFETAIKDLVSGEIEVEQPHLIEGEDS